jgi:DNA-binding GntR family transcriptional regulator
MTRRSVQKSPLKRNQVRERLADMILRGQCQPGAKLGQEELAGRFGVAQGLVREVLLELRGQGLVECSDHRGAVVTSLDTEKLLEAIELREMHEAMAVRRCCQRVSRAEARELMELAERIFNLGTGSRRDDMGAADRWLHSQLIDMSGSATLVRLADNYTLLCKSVVDTRDRRIVRDEHLAILRAISDGRADEAEAMMRRHIAALRDLVKKP